MAKNKQKLVIKPKSIHVAQVFDVPFPVSEQSVFSNGYDWKAERSRLAAVADAVNKSHSDATALEVLAAHEQLLKQHIMRRRIHSGRARLRSLSSVKLDDYAIYLSEDKAFEDVGQLSGEDTFELHTKHAVRMWEGKNDKTSQRWPGIRYGMALSGELARAAKQDNPFAHVQLLVFEYELDTVAAHLATETEKMQQQIEQCCATGIHISVVANSNPVFIKVNHMRGYGFKLLQLLMAYDEFVRVAMTIGMKGLLSNRESNNFIYETGRKVRALLHNLYNGAMKIRQIKDITRQTLLDCPEVVEKLALAVSSGALAALPEDVLMYRTLPAHVFIEVDMNNEQLQKLHDKAAASNLLEEKLDK